MTLNPLTIRKLKRFRSIRRGYWSFVILLLLLLLAVGAELCVNSRALVVNDGGTWYFPTYGAMIPGATFGLDYAYETNYRALKKTLETEKRGWVLLPPIPWNPLETDLKDDDYPPFAPSLHERHLLGTDTVGRDVLARLIYGFRTAIFFALGLLLVTYAVGISLGCLMGYLGGRFDLFFQRLIEIWSNVPFLYIVIIISSIMTPGFWTLIILMALFSWMGMTWVMRTMTYREREREYVLAARALGASRWRIIVRHILPNTLAVVVTYAPFSISGGIVSLTSLDYLGFGLPAPTPSWGELLNQGWANMDAWWIAGSVIGAMMLVLTTVTFMGEAVREAFDAKMYTYYE
ncbi:ABC transporter permease [Desulfoluna sp.]|uniref:ABC transporter permease n=1 Tax=Desulfoluna sp. TaxID=2045199 RepID=UPI00262FF715|nr:ABC transporter permease subunit [Desulfoluna sp.]